MPFLSMSGNSLFSRSCSSSMSAATSSAGRLQFSLLKLYRVSASILRSAHASTMRRTVRLHSW
jgi:hypothetical protein